MSWLKLRTSDLTKAMESLTRENVRLRRRLIEEEAKYDLLFRDSSDAVRDLYIHIRELRKKLGMDPYGDDIP